MFVVVLFSIEFSPANIIMHVHIYTRLFEFYVCLLDKAITFNVVASST